MIFLHIFHQLDFDCILHPPYGPFPDACDIKEGLIHSIAGQVKTNAWQISIKLETYIFSESSWSGVLLGLVLHSSRRICAYWDCDYGDLLCSLLCKRPFCVKTEEWDCSWYCQASSSWDDPGRQSLLKASCPILLSFYCNFPPPLYVKSENSQVEIRMSVII